MRSQQGAGLATAQVDSTMRDAHASQGEGDTGGRKTPVPPHCDAHFQATWDDPVCGTRRHTVIQRDHHKFGGRILVEG